MNTIKRMTRLSAKPIPEIELKTLEYNIKSQVNVVASLKEHIELEQTELKQAQVGIETLRAAVGKAAIDLQDTIIHAPSDGYIQNLYMGVGSSAVSHVGLFNFIDTANTYIQANLNETDFWRMSMQVTKCGFSPSIFGAQSISWGSNVG